MNNCKDALKVLEKWVSCCEHDYDCDCVCDTCEFNGSVEEFDRALRFIINYIKNGSEK